jgi:hypothetical protein
VDHAKLAAIVPLVVDSRGALPALPNVVKA